MKKEVLFITASKGYITDGLRREGYRVMYPYCYKTIVGRIVLEMMVRCKLPQSIIFNKKILAFKGKYIIVQDTIITRKFLFWLKKYKPDTKIIFDYTNLVGMARNLRPSQIPEGIDIWTYDRNDSEKYGIHLSQTGGYPTSFIGEKRKKKYDIVYVGKDKGRAEYILRLQKMFERMGLTTKFLIMPTTRITRWKSFYSKEISYEEVIKLVTESRAVLNITLPNQKGATMRDYESIYNRVKLITNNAYIKNFDFYCAENVFIINEEKSERLKEFIRTPFIDVKEEILKNHSLDSHVEEVIGVRL